MLASVLRFQALHHPELLDPVNPAGDVGILTLWSPLRSAKRKLAAISPETLDPERSRVAVIANLYGDGMYAMLCNLLFNPQVRHLIAIGEDLGLPMCEEIDAFLAHGLEETVMLGAPMKRITGTGRVFPTSPEFDERRLRERLSFRYLGKLSGATLASDLTGCLRELPRAHASVAADRLRVELPTAVANGHRPRRPSDVAAHQVLRRRPLHCWEELVVRAVRFGRAVTLRNGPRLELLNAKAVIAEPVEESADALARYGFALERLREYQARILDPALPDGISYTYGNRLRGHFRRDAGPLDTLAAASDALRANPESRHGYIALWDTAHDLPGAETAEGDETETETERASPCLTTLFFRRCEAGALSLTATYRSHNLLTAWLQNVYGLIAIQRHVAAGAGMRTGALTVVSHSLGIDPRSPRYELARTIAESWRRDEDRDHETGKYSLREDPNGYFLVTVDERERRIVAEHRFGGVLVKRYSGERADALAREISGDMAVSHVSHALWLGRELASKERLLLALDGDLS